MLTDTHKVSQVCLFQQYAARNDGKIRNGRNGNSGALGQYRMLFDGPKCPGPADRGYVRANGVSPGLFLELNRFWNSLGDPKVFQTATAGVRDSPSFGKARTLFLAGTKPRLSSIELLIGISTSSGYELATPVPSGGWLVLTVDLNKDGFFVTSISLSFA